MDVEERCFNLDFVIKFMREELWERNKGEILKNCFPRLPRDLNLRFINHNGRKAVLLKKTSSHAATFPFPPFLFSFLHRFRRILSEFEKTIDPNRPVSPRIAKVAIIADRDGARPWDYSLQTPNCQRVEWLTTSLARTCATKHALDRLFSSRQEEFKCSVERERERARADYSFTRVNYFQSLDFSWKFLKIRAIFLRRTKVSRLLFLSLSFFFISPLSFAPVCTKQMDEKLKGRCWNENSYENFRRIVLNFSFLFYRGS